MPTVSTRVAEYLQPRGGFIPPADFKIVCFEDGQKIITGAHIPQALSAIAIKCLTRYMSGTEKETAFRMPLMGAMASGMLTEAYGHLESVKGLTAQSVEAACHLAVCDMEFKPEFLERSSMKKLNIDQTSLENIRIMVERWVHFFDQYGPVVLEGFHFNGAYTKVITAGNGNFLTEDTIWDVIDLPGPISQKHTLQLLVHYLMGRKTDRMEFQKINRLGFFNPRLNQVYLLQIDRLSDTLLKKIEYDVIGYAPW